ncbi:lipoyl(octanoyl) transferase LipB [Crenothrix polyspora]|uniref:Octanoyltransferase n=1 Tax=Crenothrix polyspora TaxID=360316 RepID=A0A1R4H7C2_9GAMM|nr:lipoyl(octanoyl) transferase LipB [Crenothrix polyspora]SJM92134.1 lipoyl-protein ligase [Crenothrix polyspora]
MTAIRHLGTQDYEAIWRDMQQFTVNRTPETEDELWLVEHPSVYTLGLSGKREHLLNTGNIPVIHCDRGGQVTYHGPGQVVMYTLLDLTRLKLNIRQLVSLLEHAMIDVLASYGIDSKARADAPGVYVGAKKIGSIGIRIKKNCSYHGLSLNNHMDLRPFDHINPCGYADLKVTQLADLGIIIATDQLANRVANALTTALHS